MTLRTVLTLSGILLVVAGLAAWRSTRGPEPAAGPGVAVPDPAAPVLPGPTGPAPAPAPPVAALPRLLDFGRDT